MQYKLVALRKNGGETQKDIAILLGITEQAYRNKENGKTEFKMNEMFDIALHFNAKIEEIFLPRKYTICERGERIAH
ncbi:MAG: helix-turn-helix domain-containing protein [Liquorilactobacillus hordei]|uniref:helix-turn-helix transcriptional regulator n=1 Tax=Liquorilactobacillus hordei TaxID=468911 RepID=UPI0039EC3494